MSYQKVASASSIDKHTSDVPVLLYKHGKLFSGGNDGKIKVSGYFSELIIVRFYAKRLIY